MPVKYQIMASQVVRWALTVALLALGVGPAFADLSAPPTPDLIVRGAEIWHQVTHSQVAGDFNGDGATDWAFVAGGASPLGRTEAGLVYILWSAGGLTGLIDLGSSSSVAQSVVIPPINNWGVVSRLGVGDFNNDGKDDLVLGMPCRYPSYYCAGGARVVFGNSVFPDTVDLEAPTVPVSVITADPWVDGGLGYNSTPSDFNGDGIDDLVIAAPDDSPGEVYVIYGGPNFPMSLDLAVPSTAFTRIIDGGLGTAGTGWGLASADVNEDGPEDLLIGSPYGWPDNDGKVTLLFGQSSPPDTLVLGSPGTQQARLVTNPGVEGTLGQSVALADLDGDGEIDAAVSAPNRYWTECTCRGVIYIIRNVQNLPPITNLDQSSSVARYIGGNSNNIGGVTAGDLNSDGVADLAVGLEIAPETSGVALVPGPAPPSGATMVVTEDSTITLLLGSKAGDAFGRGTRAADMNNDGAIDLVIGATDAAGYRGETYLYFGVPVATGVPPTPFSGLAVRAFPNPFGGPVSLSYWVPVASDVTFRVYDVRGRLVATLPQGTRAAGTHSLSWTPATALGSPLPTGVYFGRLDAGSHREAVKLILMR